MNVIHQSIKVVFNLLEWLDDDPAARDHKIHLLLEAKAQVLRSAELDN